jgi:WD40-like Beta Propeller Repeat
LLVDGDRLPTWAPDGRHFVTAREMGGYRFDANGLAIRNEAVMLHDHEDLQNPRVLLIADHGGISGAIDDFTWSPDGRYVLYTLYESADAANVWWLDVTTGPPVVSPTMVRACPSIGDSEPTVGRDLTWSRGIRVPRKHREWHAPLATLRPSRAASSQCGPRAQPAGAC